MYRKESKIIIVNESSTKESESKFVHKSVNKEKYAKIEAELEEPLFMDNTIVKEPRYFNIFKCVRNLLKNLDATCKRACMANSGYKYYTELLRTITYAIIVTIHHYLMIRL